MDAFLTLRDRITPAYAGTLNIKDFNDVIQQDHPRIRGNTNLIAEDENYKLGSPPHTREHSELLGGNHALRSPVPRSLKATCAHE